MARKKPLDIKGYYRLLKVSVDAGPDEIRLATAIAKQNATGPHLKRIDEAWGALSVPRLRQQYDSMGLERPNPLKSPWTLVVCAVILAGIYFWLYAPGIAMRSKTFTVGQMLVDIRTRQEFGIVVQVDQNHRFSNGEVRVGYLVRAASGGSDRWYPAIDLQSTMNAR
jgi:curved DNA-binding protein CbpA